MWKEECSYKKTTKNKTIRINGNKLTSGIYFYNVISPSGRKSFGKLVIK
ncbi:MAG: T9SS type A sorting domain-containing protein [Bacteroidetes bacterium]|nr:T9SS type A sorting domain-containing protein [Bacteroidota bacterium]